MNPRSNISFLRSIQFSIVDSLFLFQLNWSNKGLPTDALSQENAMILFNTTEIPLIIDPSGRASSFLEEHLKDRQLEKVNANDSNFLTQVIYIYLQFYLLKNRKEGEVLKKKIMLYCFSYFYFSFVANQTKGDIDFTSNLGNLARVFVFIILTSVLG